MNPKYRFKIERPTLNLLDPYMVIKGFTLSSSTGAVSASSTMQISDFMPVEEGETYAFKDSSNESLAFPALAFYDADKEFISGAAGTLTAEAPTGAAFARLAFSRDYDAAEWQFAKSSLGYYAFVSPWVFPTWANSTALSFEKESGQEFFRRKLSGQMKFTGPDYDYITAQAFDHEFKFYIYISYDGGQTWAEYWRGKFYKTDCDFNDDDKVITVTPTLDDNYNAVIAGLEKEFDLISLAPEIAHVYMDKRPMLQFYVPGSSVVGCYLSGMWWEQECEPTNDNERLAAGKFFLSAANDKIVVEISQTGGTPTLPLALFGQSVQGHWQDGWNCTAGGYTFYCEPLGGGAYWFRIVDSNNNTLWVAQGGNPVPEGITVHLTPVAGSGATGEIDAYLHLWQTYTRIVCDVETQDTAPIPADDIVGNMRNYRYVAFANFPGVVALSSNMSETPTEWGLYQPGAYYKKPFSDFPNKVFPLSRDIWGKVSTWIDSYVIPAALDETYRAEFTLRHAYPIASVISVLLGQIAPGITHEDSTDYSRFLYSENDPLFGLSHHLFISPKSNLVNSGYDQPAQKAPIRLSNVLNMLRDCFRCYWFIDEQKRFRIEHIEFFRRGGTYSAVPDPTIGIDLTTLKVPRSGKAWAFNTNKYKFEKPEMAARYQFGWMDDVTKQFNGSPIDIVSGYVDPDRIDQITVNNFTSDVDYILLNPGAVSQDGFVLMIATIASGQQSGTLTSGKFINTNGGISSHTGMKMMEFTNIEPGKQYKAKNFGLPSSGWTGVPMVNYFNGETYLGYDSAFPLQGPFSYTDWQTLNVPSDCTRIVINTHTSIADPQLSTVPLTYYKVPYINIGEASLQNGPLSFDYLEVYYRYDMPALYYKIDGVTYQASGVKKLKTQPVSFPCYRDPDMLKLVKTLMGNGMLEKLSLNLCSRFADATLRYDTEQ